MIVFAVILFLTAFPVALVHAGNNRAVEGRHGMVVSENAYATHAGLEILEHGGNAIDAACAAELAIGVTNPGAAGLGGGGFMLVYLAKPHAFYALDFRETAPLRATPGMYLRNGKPDGKLALIGPLAVGVPGEAAGIGAALKRFGTIKFQRAAAEAETLAANGYAASPHLAAEISENAAALKRDPELRKIFFTRGGVPRKAGEPIRDTDLAATLKKLGDDPAANFYHGPIAHRIAALMKSKGGIIGTADLAGYGPVWAAPLEREYHGYEVHVMPPPSSGGVLLEMLGMLAPGHLAGLGVNSPPYLARLIEVMRQGFIERNRYADPAFVHVPIAELLSDSHIAKLRDRALHGKTPPPTAAPAHDHGTSNLIVTDKDGNVVALTSTINTAFGAKIAVPGLGIILNNEMDDFAVAPGVPNVYRLEGAAANEIQPGKRPLSSMTPIIVTKNGRPVMSAGGSGGPLILSGVLQVTLDILDFHLGAAGAVALPRIHEQAAPATVLAEDSMPAGTIRELHQMGYDIRLVHALGAIDAIAIEPGNLRGAFDPRKGGGAAGY
ncbi:MAG: gamma-glutamyltransferase [Candidatus Binataceae bacterium]